MNRKIKIVHIIDSMAEGGTQEFLINYLKLSNLDEARIYLLQLNSDNGYETEIAGLNCQHIIVNEASKSIFGKLNPLTIVKVYRLLRSIKPDIVHTRLYLSLIYGLLPAKLLARKKLLYTIEGSFKQTGVLYRFLVKLLSPWIDLFFTAYSREYKNANLPKHAYQRYVACLEFQDRGDSTELDMITKCPRIGPNIGSVGRLHHDKGHQFAIEAILHIRELHPGAKLFIAGSGPYEPALRKRVFELGVEKAVVFCGFVKNINQFWSHMDIGVQCSINETINLSSYGAMNAGVPVVKFAIPGIQELIDIENERFGFYAMYLSPLDLHRKISKLLGDKLLYGEFSTNAHNYAKRHLDASKGADYYDQIYRELINNLDCAPKQTINQEEHQWNWNS